MNKTSKGKGFIYTLYAGKLTIEEGEIYDYIYDERLGSFKTKNKRRLASMYPEVVYNGNIWLVKRDDNLAIKLLLDNEENAILLLEEKIINHRIKIQSIKMDLVINFKEA